MSPFEVPVLLNLAKQRDITAEHPLFGSAPLRRAKKSAEDAEDIKHTGGLLKKSAGKIARPTYVSFFEALVARAISPR
jgi:hypothetical protein